MYIKSLPLGPVAANCYILVDESTKNGAVIDPGDFDSGLVSAIEASGLEALLYILCTHGHFDHVSGVSRLKEKYPEAKVVIGKEDASCLSDGSLNAASSFGLPFYPCVADITVSEGDIIKFGETELSVVDVPGHTPGGILYINADNGVIFSGDTLFCGSVGRTDLRGGNTMQLIRTLKKFKDFPHDWNVYCGHGEKTTIGQEIQFNPYLR